MVIGAALVAACAGDSTGGAADAATPPVDAAAPPVDAADEPGPCPGDAPCFFVLADLGVLARSVDGATWTVTEPFQIGAISGYPRALAAHPAGRIVAVGDLGSIQYSDDFGTSWTPATERPFDVQLRDVAHGAGRWVAVGTAAGGGIALYTSDDAGDEWRLAEAPDTAPALAQGVTFAGGVWAAVGTGGTALRSTDGATWRLVDPETTASLYDVAHVFGRFYAVGEQGVVVHSADFETGWIEDPTLTDTTWIQAATGDYPFIMLLGESPTHLMMPSEGGAVWWNVARPTVEALGALASGGDRWIAAGDYTPSAHHLYYTDDVGQTWHEATADGIIERPTDALYLASPTDCDPDGWWGGELWSVAVACGFTPSEGDVICLQATFAGTGELIGLEMGDSSHVELTPEQLGCARDQLLGYCDPERAASSPDEACASGI